MSRHIRFGFGKNEKLPLGKPGKNAELLKKQLKELGEILVFLLEKGEATVYDIRKGTGIAQATLYSHINWFLKDGLIRRVREESFKQTGLTKKYYALTPQGFDHLTDLNSLTSTIQKLSGKKWLEIAARNPELAPTLFSKAEEWKMTETPEFFRFLTLNRPWKTLPPYFSDDGEKALTHFVGTSILYIMLKEEIEKVETHPLADLLIGPPCEWFFPFGFLAIEGMENIDVLKSEVKIFLKNNPNFLGLVEAILKDYKQTGLEAVKHAAKTLEGLEEAWKKKSSI